MKLAIAALLLCGSLCAQVLTEQTNSAPRADSSRIFDGSRDYLVSRLPLNLRSAKTISIWFRANLFWFTPSSQTGVLFETSANFNANDGAFAVYTDGRPRVVFDTHASSGYTTNEFSAASLAPGWHDFLLVLSTNSPGTAFVDGVPQKVESSAGGGGSLSPHKLYVMSRGGASQPSAGTLAQVAIWAGALHADDAVRLHGGADPCRQNASSLLACWGFTGGSPEPDLSGNGNVLEVKGTVPEAADSPSGWRKVGCSPAGSTGITALQWDAGAGGAVSVMSTNFSHPVKAGHVVIVGARWDNPAATAKITDNYGNTYVAMKCAPQFPLNFGRASRMQLWYSVLSRGGGGEDVTIHLSALARSYVLIDLWELSGVDTHQPIDVCRAATSAANGPKSSIEFTGLAPKTTHDKERIVGAFFSEGNNTNWVAGPCSTGVAQEAMSYYEYRDVTQTYAPAMWVSGGNQDPPDWAGVVFGLRAE